MLSVILKKTMNKQNYEIKDNFQLFEKLCNEVKIIEDEKILLVEKSNNKKWLEGDSHCILNSNKNLFLIVEKQKLDKKYHIKFRCSDLSKVPFFRFDSDGPAHRNNDETIPLEKQRVTTPHFNSFNKDGYSVAYKNEILNDQEKSEIISNDINFGISLFCQESNSQLIDSNFPIIFENEQTLDFNYEEMIDYESLNFD